MLLLGGPALGAVAGAMLVRSWRLNRNLAGAGDHVDSPPMTDLTYLTGLQIPAIGPIAVALIAAGCAFVRDVGERGPRPWARHWSQ